MRLTRRENLAESYERWDLEVEDTHSFVAEGVVVHNSNCRLGYINGKQVSGSMELRRKPPTKAIDPENGSPAFIVDLNYDDPEFLRNTYWFPWSIDGVRELLGEFGQMAGVKTVELFGEVYGSPIQKGFKYDAKDGGLGFRAFGIKVNDKFLDWDEFEGNCSRHGVPVVPVLHRGVFDQKLVLALAEGKTTIGEAPVREGVVVVPAKERVDPKVGRATLKYVGYGYDLLKGKPDCKDV